MKWKMICRRCKLEVEVGEMMDIEIIQGYQCPAAVQGIGHWLKAVK